MDFASQAVLAGAVRGASASVFVVAAAALTAVVWWRHGFSLMLSAVGAGGVLAVVWSQRSGRAYVEQMFARYQPVHSVSSAVESFLISLPQLHRGFRAWSSDAEPFVTSMTQPQRWSGQRKTSPTLSPTS
jgi:hypothetical protein